MSGFDPFRPDPHWFEKHWYGEKAARRPVRLAGAFATVVLSVALVAGGATALQRLGIVQALPAAFGVTAR
jgi:hypothetical protein